MRAFVTGGAGFIGSHIVDRLLDLNYEVTVYDNMSTGQRKFIEHNLSKINFIKADVLNFEKLKKSIKDHDIVFHLQANADVRGGIKNTRIDLEQNTIATWNVLEAMRLNKIKKIVFSSTGSIYGEPDQFPTPEDYHLIQTSMYGASKLASEGLIQAFCEGFQMRAYIFRFVSVMGERYTHGCVFDFINKLLTNPKSLHILGNGRQKKSYIYIKDLLNGIFTGLEKAQNKVNIFNLGTEEFIDVNGIAGIVVEEIGLKKVEFTYEGGVRGWIGDSPFILLSIEKIKKLGWVPEYSIEQAVRKTAQYLLSNKQLLKKKE